MHKPSTVKSVFARRLQEARLRMGIPQDRLGIMIGLDEGSSSARMSRYENGIHEPPFPVTEKIAQTLGVPVAYFFCADDKLAEIMLVYENGNKATRQTLFETAVKLGEKRD